MIFDSETVATAAESIREAQRIRRDLPAHPSHSPAPAWLRAVCDDLTRLGFDELAADMGVPPCRVVDLDEERRNRR